MLQDLLSAQKSAFKDYTELRAQVNTTRQVAFLAGNMVSNAQSSESGVSARVYKGGKPFQRSLKTSPGRPKGFWKSIR